MKIQQLTLIWRQSSRIEDDGQRLCVEQFLVTRENRLQFIRRFPRALLRAASFMPVHANMLCSHRHRHRSNCILKQTTHHNHHTPPPKPRTRTCHTSRIVNHGVRSACHRPFTPPPLLIPPAPPARHPHVHAAVAGACKRSTVTNSKAALHAGGGRTR